MAGSVADGRRAQIVRVALGLLERDGPQGVTMRAIAEHLGIRAPSLYKHFPDKEALEVAMMADGLERFAAAFEKAATTGPRAGRIRALGRTYRAWALAHPHLYRLLTDRPLPRSELPVGLEARAARPLVEAFGGNPDLARAAWALAHGLSSLELAGRFPAGADVDAAWHAGFRALSIGRGA
jgi:AcrR family transcriptional regulator